MQRTQWAMILLFILGLGLQGCSKSPAATAPAAPKMVQLTPAWEAMGLKGPESAAYDAKNDVIYVSNINGQPTEKNGAGFISKIGTDGKVINLEWVMGLNAPKGLAVHNEVLYVASVGEVLEISTATGEVVRRHLAADAKFLNDVATDENGNVYISDMGDNAIYRLTSDGMLALWLKNDALEFPNGLYVMQNQLIVASWGVITDPSTFGTQVPGHLKTISLQTPTVMSLGNGKSVGNLDGLVSDGMGNYFASDWAAGKIYQIQPSGEVQTLLLLKQGSADIGLIPAAKLLLVPMMMDGKLAAFHIQ